MMRGWMPGGWGLGGELEAVGDDDDDDDGVGKRRKG